MRLEATGPAERFRNSGYDRWQILDVLRLEDLPGDWKRRALAACAQVGIGPADYDQLERRSLPARQLGPMVMGHCYTVSLIWDVLAGSACHGKRIQLVQQRSEQGLVHCWLDIGGQICDPTREQYPLIAGADYARGKPARRPLRAETQGGVTVVVHGEDRRVGIREGRVLERMGAWRIG